MHTHSSPYIYCVQPTTLSIMPFLFYYHFSWVSAITSGADHIKSHKLNGVRPGQHSGRKLPRKLKCLQEGVLCSPQCIFQSHPVSSSVSSGLVNEVRMLGPKVL